MSLPANKWPNFYFRDASITLHCFSLFLLDEEIQPAEGEEGDKKETEEEKGDEKAKSKSPHRKVSHGSCWPVNGQ